MHRFGLLPALLLAAEVQGPVQQVASGDQGIFAVQLAGASAGTEKFTITSKTGPAGTTYMFTSTRTVPFRETATTRLQTDSIGNPTSYRRQESGDSTRKINASIGTGRLTVVTSGTGFHVTRDYVLRRGTLVLDDDLVSELYLLFLGDLARPVTYVSPASGVTGTGALVDLGPEEVILGNRASLPARHFAFGTAAATREIWIDSNKRLLKVAIPGRQMEAVRSEPPP